LFENVDLTPFGASEDQEMDMRRLWLAVVLGVILGLGTTLIPDSVGSGAKPSALMSTMGAQRTFEVSTSASSQFEWVLIGLLLGLVVAVPVFGLARRRI